MTPLKLLRCCTQGQLKDKVPEEELKISLLEECTQVEEMVPMESNIVDRTVNVHIPEEN